MLPEGLSYDDVLLLPRKGILEKRGDADLSSIVTQYETIEIPIIAAPMPSVTEANMARAMLALGAQAVIHRFQAVDIRFENWFDSMSHSSGEPFVAIGLKDGWKDFEWLHDKGVTFFCLDVAHGHHYMVGNLVKMIKTYDPEVRLMVGNVATGHGAIYLAEAGADAVKVGIGPGAACRTREVTGFGVPQLSAISEVYEWLIDQAMHDTNHYVAIIADGGIKNSGDIVKALAAGADSVMLGSLLAGADEAPTPGEYYGNASSRVNGHRAPEGAEGVVPTTGPVENIIKELTWGIRSGISYGGGTDLSDLRDNARFIRVAPGTALESAVRV